MIAPLAKTGLISEALNLWLAVPIGFLFGFGLYHGGFTDSRKIGRVFYFKDVAVPVAMFSAIVTGALGLWGLSLSGFLDVSKVYLLPTYLAPMAVGGLLFGVGMVVGGYCPGTAMAAIVNGKLDALVFVIGFMIGSLLFGDLFPVWGEFYLSDYRGTLRLDQLFHVELGLMLLILVVVAITGIWVLRSVQRLLWSGKPDNPADEEQVLTPERALGAVALLVALALAWFPTDAFIEDHPTPPYYIVPKAPAGTAPAPSTP